jgi:predicted dehydrogenase
MVGIIGSGFGLYGYLPAVALMATEKILISQRYKEKFYKRPELFIFENKIQWVKDLNEIIQQANCVILSVNPEIQSSIIHEHILGSRIKNLILEKPVAVSPQESIELLNKLQISEINFRIGYNLRYTEWVEEIIKLQKITPQKTIIRVDWSFLAYHYRNNVSTWKRNHLEGGGVLRFYGIHFIALASFLKYDFVIRSSVNTFSENDHHKCDIELRNTNGDQLIIHINSFADVNRFQVLLNSYDNSTNCPLLNISQKDPFTNQEIGDLGILDHRIGTLQNIYNSLFDASLNIESNEIYNRTNELWLQIEKVTTYQID